MKEKERRMARDEEGMGRKEKEEWKGGMGGKERNGEKE